ncbi:hypothetical protein GCM10007939_23360 [Amylibacter marinus]|uniref:DUF1150 domain-containing protein n=1 Tax=Amylibacter marinus TaxID=1475483 RepID=A0ABQ5VXN5_9RHOB|nr:DUF1150 family protein [Amylibacter marinus]GLQ36052.1 hypothetical protein GCM10007939_23360 [Amylibacter marinus]
MTPVFEQMGLPSNIVYIRPITLADLPRDIQMELGDNTPLFAVFSEDGTQIALVEDQNVAFALAKEHEFNLQSVH